MADAGESTSCSDKELDNDNDSSGINDSGIGGAQSSTSYMTPEMEGLDLACHDCIENCQSLRVAMANKNFSEATIQAVFEEACELRKRDNKSFEVLKIVSSLTPGKLIIYFIRVYFS